LVLCTTTQATPHIDDPTPPPPSPLHRVGVGPSPFAARSFARDHPASQNWVDDVESRHERHTSLHLAKNLAGLRPFVSATLGELLFFERALDRKPNRHRCALCAGILDLSFAFGSTSQAMRAEESVAIADFFFI